MISLIASGCGNSLNCAIKGDNLKGRITFTAAQPARANTWLMVEWSKDSFSTVSGSSSKQNVHGLLSVPYSLCVDNNVDIQVRAYQDFNGNTAFDTGEPSGRYDQTSNGDAAFVPVSVPQTSGTSASSSEDWRVKEGVDIAIDTP